jgi:hypothetical protein
MRRSAADLGANLRSARSLLCRVDGDDGPSVEVPGFTTLMIGLPGGSGCGLKAWAVPEASPIPASATPGDRRVLPRIFFVVRVVFMVVPSLPSAVAALG